MRDLLMVGVIAFGIGAGGAWKVASWRYGEQIAQLERDHAQAGEKAQAEARGRESELRGRIATIERESNEKYQRLETDLSAARRAAGGLQVELENIRARATRRDPLVAPECQADRDTTRMLAQLLG